ncbi:hypothetical protein ACN4EE_07230 [Geminocystis sp. CENA526]|uniref:hypothetical protein n=1 Tax=Geminocystis sp. CENA526 TaxID=1355871 RepID=UPI003D6DFF70
MIISQNNSKSIKDSGNDTLFSLLKAKGYNTQLKEGLQITSASQGSGRNDISVNHDQILAE